MTPFAHAQRCGTSPRPAPSGPGREGERLALDDYRDDGSGLHEAAIRIPYQLLERAEAETLEIQQQLEALGYVE